MDNLKTSLTQISQNLIEQLVQKEKEYAGSWKKRGGVGAFMMLARKWDRIEEAARKCNWDIFQVLEKDYRPEGTMDDIDDLISYLLLVKNHITKSRPGIAHGSSSFEHAKER